MVNCPICKKIMIADKTTFKCDNCLKLLKNDDWNLGFYRRTTINPKSGKITWQYYSGLSGWEDVKPLTYKQRAIMRNLPITSFIFR
jgi:hypothetical protein